MFVFEEKRLRPLILAAIAFLPCFVFAVLKGEFSVLLNLFMCMAGELLCDVIYCLITKKSIDFMVLSCALLASLLIGKNSGILVPAVCGVAVFVLFLLYHYISILTSGKLLFDPLPAAFLAIMFISTPYTPADLIVTGKVPEGIRVIDMITGNYESNLPALSCTALIIIAFVFYAIRKKVKPLSALICIASFMVVSALLYKTGDATQLQYLSFVMLDGRIVFSLIFMIGIYSFRGITGRISAAVFGALAALSVVSGSRWGFFLTALVVSAGLPVVERWLLENKSKKAEKKAEAV